MGVTTNTFLKLNQDNSISAYKPGDYYDCMNFHPVTHGGLSTGSIENEKGTKLSFKLPSVKPSFKVTLSGDSFGVLMIKATNTKVAIVDFNHLSYGTATTKNLYKCILANVTVQQQIADGYYSVHYRKDSVYIAGLDELQNVTAPNGWAVCTPEVANQSDLIIVGMTEVRGNVVVFSTSSTNSGIGQIWKFKLNDDETIANIGANDYLVPSKHLIYNNHLNFNPTVRVGEIVSKYFSTDEVKIYFVDGVNYLRHFNIANPDGIALTPDKLSIVSNVVLNKPMLVSVDKGGIYTSGVVQYAYNLYNINGVETVFSPLTGMIPLNKSTYADDPEVNTNKSVTIKINDIDTNYDVIRVVAIFYPFATAIPEIRVIDERNIPEIGTVYITDDGSKTLGTYTSQELITIGNNHFIPSTLTTKDELLIVGNINTEYYDVEYDARAYRFDSTGTTAKVKHDGVAYDIDNTFKVNGEDVPVDFDCELPKKWQYANTLPLLDSGIIETGYNCAYNLDHVLGGEGVNVKYSFRIVRKADNYPNATGLSSPLASSNNINGDNLDTLYTTYPNLFVQNQSTLDYKSPYMREQYVGYQRDEVYRFGVRFINVKGQKTPVKWIGDIKFPAAWEDAEYNICGIFGDWTAFNILGIDFTFTNLPESVVSLEIVRCKRETQDKTVVSNGWLVPLVFGTGNYYRPYSKDYTGAYIKPGLLGLHNNAYTQYISPEVCIDKKVSGTYFRVNVLNDYVASIYDGTSNNRYLKFTNTFIPDKIEKRNLIEGIIDGNKNDDSSADVSLSGLAYPLRLYINDSTHHKAKVGTSFFNKTETGFTTTINPSTPDAVLFVNECRDLLSQYGGASYAERSNSEYIVCQSFYITDSLDTGAIPTFGGDTYIGFFEFIRGIRDLEEGGATNHFECNYLPVESSINIDLREKCLNNFYNNELIQEKAGVYTDDGTPYTIQTLNQTNDLYDINKVYSKESDLIKAYPEPLNFKERLYFGERAYASEKQLNTINDVDYWTKFLYNNFIDLDSRYGPISKLEFFKGRVFAFQKDAFGILSINERQAVTTLSGTNLAIGTGGILERIDYITNTSGTIHKNSVVNTGEALHFIDIGDRKWYRYTGDQVEPESVVKGLGSFFRTHFNGDIKSLDTTLNDIGVHGVYDKDNMRVLMTFLNGTEKYTISFNELTDAFESFYSYTPKLYCGFDDKIFSTKDGVGWLHGRGDYNSFYGRLYDSYITLIINKDYDVVKLFNNCEFNSECFDSNSLDQFDETITAVRAWNDYQNTTDKTFVQDSTLRRRMRQWWFAVPRDEASQYRMRGQYIFLKLLYSNTANRRLVLHDLNTFYSQ